MPTKSSPIKSLVSNNTKASPTTRHASPSKAVSSSSHDGAGGAGGAGVNSKSGGRPRPMRIPATLQAVFLASNRGKEVHKPPPERVAAKVFFRNWLFQGRKSGGGSGKNIVSRKPSRSGANGTAKGGGEIEEENGVASLSSIDKREGKPQSKPKVPEPIKIANPQDYLDNMIRARGYSTTRYQTLDSGYYNKPTALQQASYNVYLIQIVRQNNEAVFRDIMSSGISVNPCNSYGESLLHMICRRGDTNLLKIMIENGTELQIADDYGRTPLHDACWAPRPCFEIVELIVKVDLRLLHMTDCRGAVPLSYVRQEHWDEWVDWLESKKHAYWPVRDAAKLGPEKPPPLTEYQPNSRPIQDPIKSLTPQLAAMVASGKMKANEAKILRKERVDDTTADESLSVDQSDGEGSSDEDSSSDYDSDDDDDDDLDDDVSDISDSDDDSMDQEELADLFNNLNVPKDMARALMSG